MEMEEFVEEEEESLLLVDQLKEELK